MAKFEATAAEGVVTPYASDGSCPTAVDNDSTKTIQSLPNETSWRCITNNNIFLATRLMESKNIYGWSTASTLKADGTYEIDNNNVDTHMMKNVEWGAVAYLSKSEYGKYNLEVYLNNAETYETGCAAYDAGQGPSTTCLNRYDTPNGMRASTTGTIYGVYDMSGGSWERVAAYVNNEHSNLNGNGLSIVNALGKYKDIYILGDPDNQEENHDEASKKKGDAIYETSSNSTANSNLGWNGDYTNMPHASIPWFGRGGGFNFYNKSGPFAFFYSNGDTGRHAGFRPVLLVGKGL